MNFVDLKTEILSVEHNGITYTKTIYKSAASITGAADENHPIWDANTNFKIGDFCIVPELKSIYKSSFGTEQTPNKDIFPPANTSKWIWFGYINSANMFAMDEHIGSSTKGVDMVITLDFNMLNTLALVDVNFVSLQIKQINNKTQEELIQNINGIVFAGRSFAEVMYNPRKRIKKAILDKLKWLPDSKVILTFTGAVSIGTLGMGRIESFGATMKGTKLNWESSSQFKIDEFSGYRNVLRYGKARSLDVQIIFDTINFNSTALRVDDILDRNMLWLPTKLDIFTEAITIGYLENFSLPLDGVKIQTNATIVGVNK
jgi:hypothetical protein